MYSDNLDDEKKPSIKRLLPEGWRTFQFKAGKEETSKAGNSMFKMNIEDMETEYTEDIYVVRTPGKRWTLKCILSSFGIERQPDGNYTYDIPDLLNKDILGLVAHEPNEYINRQGDIVKTEQHKIIDFKAVEQGTKQVPSPEDIAWGN